MTQEEALRLMKSGRNVLLTGPAGAGKSWLLRKFISETRRKTVVTATTGLAASHLNGQTLHRWSGIGLGEKLPDDYIYRISKTRVKQIKATKTLIIDEVSMLNDYNFEMVDEALRMICENDEPFGGIQVILCGDFFQLPPVTKGRNGKFVFETELWDKMDLEVCYLREQHRAKDSRLEDILNSMRADDMRNRHLRLLLSRINLKTPEYATKLYVLNKDVDYINSRELAKIRGDSHYYLRTSRGSSVTSLDTLQKSVMAPELIELKLGCVVMAVRNDPSGRFHNGSIGPVVAFTEEGLPVVNFGSPTVIEPEEWELRAGDRVMAAITQLPLRLAYAITVHKSQGMTLDAAEIDLREAFVEGMGYTALSRVGNLDDLYLKGINQRSLRVSQKAIDIDRKLKGV